MTLVLLFLAYGYSLGKNGQIIQNGLVFVSSTPNPAQIYLNGELNKTSTDSRLQLPAGEYTMKLVRSGYRPWVRAVGVGGGSVEHFDYPFLFPVNLSTTIVEQYKAAPSLVLQSPDQRWLLLQQPGDGSSFREYDLNNQKQLVPSATTISVPNSILTSPASGGSWHLVGWADDNQHVVLQHNYSGGSEYILFDRQVPADSVNLTKTLKLDSTTELLLDNLKYNQYYLFDSSNDSLSTTTLSSPQMAPVLSGVLAFKTYGDNTILYVTADKAAAGQVNVDIQQGAVVYKVRSLPTDSSYLLNLTQYQGSWYAAVGSPSQDEVYVYQNPTSQLINQSPNLPVPVAILKVTAPDYLDFSTNAQFVVAEGDNSFAVYDAANQKTYSYNFPIVVPPGQHATWMDGDRLVFVSSSKVVVWDYDGANHQTLQPALDGTTPVFDAAYKWVYVIAPSGNADTPFALTSTALRIPADQ